MLNKLLIIFALKEEFGPWKARHQFRPLESAPHSAFMASIGGTEVTVAIVGAGARAIGRVGDLSTQIGPSYAVVTGVAAGLKSNWRPGDVLVANQALGLDLDHGIAADPKLLQLAVRCGARLVPTFLTTPRIVRTVEEKVRLGLLADAAEMESLLLMEMWSTRGIPAVPLRVILDPVEMPMPCDFESAMNDEGQVRVSKIVGQLFRRPKLLPDLIHLASQNRVVLRKLADFLDQFVSRLGTELQEETR